MEDLDILELETSLLRLKTADIRDEDEIVRNLKLLIGIDSNISIETCQEFMKKIYLNNHTFSDILQISVSYLCLFESFQPSLRLFLIKIIKKNYENVFFNLTIPQMDQMLELVIQISNKSRLKHYDDLKRFFYEFFKELKVYLRLIKCFFKYLFEYHYDNITLDSLIKKLQKNILKAQKKSASNSVIIHEKIMKKIPSYAQNFSKIDSSHINIIMESLSSYFPQDYERLVVGTEKKRFKTIQPILEEIDIEIVENFCLNNVLIDDWYLKMMKKAEEILKKHKETLESKVENYKNTRYKEIPEIEDILSEFIIQLLDVNLQKEIFLTIQALKSSIKIISFKTTLENLLVIPLEDQYIYAELFLKLSDDPGNTLRYFFRTDFVNQACGFIPSDWAQSFIQRVCCSPFNEVLSKFNQNRSILPEDINEVTKNIKLVPLPQNLSGINLHNGSIVINAFDTNFNREVTFAVYLHELSHFLLRKDCLTIADHMQNKSLESKEINSIEGGVHLEKLLFGEALKEISYHAANYLLNLEIPVDLDSFREKFFNLNQDKSSGYARVKGSTRFFIGYCGFRKNRLIT